MELAGKHALVIGLGVTGRALVRFLSIRGCRVTVAEQRTMAEPGGLGPRVEVRVGREDPAWLAGVDLVIPSPGVPRTNPLLVAARQAEIAVLSEIELASRFLDRITVAITGTNGKSTVTGMIGHMLKSVGRRPFVGGNLGTPLIEAVGRGCDCAVVEVSSFQLEWITSLRPQVGVYLNLTEDHLDRYRDLDEYGSFKGRLFEFQRLDDWAVLNRDDPRVWRLAGQVASRVMSFGAQPVFEGDAIWPTAEGLCFALNDQRGQIRFDAVGLPGRHNLSNAMAAAAASLLAGVSADQIARALASFKGLHHRIEKVREKDGVSFVDDSKGTNVGAVVEALASIVPPIILLAGGVDKGGDYAPLRGPLKERVKALIVYGQARDKMHAALEGSTRIEIRDSLGEAFSAALMLAAPGDTVLLSPACSSFDQFSSYVERGNKFQELVRAL